MTNVINNFFDILYSIFLKIAIKKRTLSKFFTYKEKRLQLKCNLLS